MENLASLARVMAFKDITAENRSHRTIVVIGLEKSDLVIVKKSYTGVTKKSALSKFNEEIHDLFSTFIAAFDADKELENLWKYEDMLKRNSQRYQRRWKKYSIN